MSGFGASGFGPEGLEMPSAWRRVPPSATRPDRFGCVVEFVLGLGGWCSKMGSESVPTDQALGYGCFRK